MTICDSPYPHLDFCAHSQLTSLYKMFAHLMHRSGAKALGESTIATIARRGSEFWYLILMDWIYWTYLNAMHILWRLLLSSSSPLPEFQIPTIDLLDWSGMWYKTSGNLYPQWWSLHNCSNSSTRSSITSLWRRMKHKFVSLLKT